MKKVSPQERIQALGSAMSAAAVSGSVTSVASPRPAALGPVAEAARNLEAGLRAQLRRYHELESQGRMVLTVDPKTIGPSRFKNRDPRSLSRDDPKLIATKESIFANGQDTPITVFAYKEHPRPNTDPAAANWNYEYEIVVGRRRHAACLWLDSITAGGFPVLAIVIHVESDLDLTQLIHRENREREDLSAFEYGEMFQDWLDRSLYASQSELAAAVGYRDRTIVGRYLRIPQLPAFVLDAFGDTRNIAVSWGDPLHGAIKVNPTAVEAVAKHISSMSERPSAQEIYDALCNPDQGLSPTAMPPDGKDRTRQRRSHSLRTQSIKVGGRVALKFGIGKHKLVLRTAPHVKDDLQKEFVRTVSDYAEKVLRGLMGDLPPDNPPDGKSS